MASVAFVPKNSTTVRISKLERDLLVSALRTAAAAASAVSVGAAAERLGADLFFRPGPTKTDEPLVVGHPARRLTVRSGPYRLATWTWGEGPTVLLAHGWEGRAAQLAPLVAPLLDEGFRVVAFDMPAHGSSTGTTVSAVEMARAIRDVAEETAPLYPLAQTALHGLVAHSLGGIAATLALGDGLAARRAVLLAPASEPTYYARRAATLLGLRGPRLEGLLQRVTARLGGDLDAVHPLTVARRIATPALILHADDDRDVPIAQGEALAAAWPGARLDRLHGLGHRKLLRDSTVHARVARFLAEIDDA